MIVQYFLPDGSDIIFKEINRKQYEGIWLQGSKILQANCVSGTIILQEFENALFVISHRILEIISKEKFVVKERQGLRFEALLTGELNIIRNDKKLSFKAGQYHLTDVPLFTSIFSKATSCNIFITYFSNDLLKQLGLELAPCDPLRMPDKMSYLINEIIHNPYVAHLRDFYYENSVRELLFFHLAQDQRSMPGELNDRDIAAIYKADEIIASDLQQHHTIDKLSRLTGTNEFKLKKGFRDIFGMGVFRRLLLRRMEHAKALLETTSKSIGEIAGIAGYDTTAGFIHAFRREFKMTPREWRHKQRRDETLDGDSNAL